MPQSSLMGWLRKPVSKQTTEASREYAAQQTPAPHSTSDEDNIGSENASMDQVKPQKRPSTQGLPPNVELRECRNEDIKSFKRLNSLLLPIPYGDSFYREIIEDEVTSSITLMAIWHNEPAVASKEKGTLVGAIRCRLLAGLPGSAPIPRKEGPMLYLSTLVLLSPYRGHGIAAKMLDVVVRRAVNDYGAGSVGAHVWEANEEGLAWYRKRGFKEIGREQGYYRRLIPQGAVVMIKDVGVMDLLER